MQLHYFMSLRSIINPSYVLVSDVGTLTFNEPTRDENVGRGSNPRTRLGEDSAEAHRDSRKNN